MNGYCFYKVYSGIRLHFTTNFDALKYGGNCKSVTEESFHNRRDKSRFDQWAAKINKNDAIQFCVFNFAHSDNNWFYGEFETARLTYLKTKGYFAALKYNITNELQLIENLKQDKNLTFKNVISYTKSGFKPPLLQLMVRGSVSKEFVCLLDRTSNFLESWMEQSTDDPLMSIEVKNLTAYKPYCNILSKSNG